MDENEIREIAKKQLKRQAEFKRYLWVWLAVSVMLTVIWALTGLGTYFWPAWVMFGMGVGALFSGIDAYSKNTKVISEADIEAEVHRLKGTKPAGPGSL